MPIFKVKYFYLASGMEGNPDTWELEIEAETASEAVEKVVAMEPNQAPEVISFFRGCLSVEGADGAKIALPQWFRHYFKTTSVDDWRPVIYNPAYPSYCTGYAGDDSYATIVAWLPSTEYLKKYWPEAYDDTFTVHSKIEFSDRFPKPADFTE